MKRLYVEFADTPIKREYGLKNRRYLHRNAGMLFKFPYSYRLGFWMQDTYLPLDIAFLSDNGEILQISEMIPMSTRPVISKKICRYALETNKNWFKNNNVDVGSKVGGEYFSRRDVFAQMNGSIVGPEGFNGEQADFGQENQGQQFQVQEEPPPVSNPDVYLNRTFKDIFENANVKNRDLIVVYQKKDGYVLPPKRVSPPYEFWTDADGRLEAIVNLWDNQDGGWKSFLINNILDIEFAE